MNISIASIIMSLIMQPDTSAKNEASISQMVKSMRTNTFEPILRTNKEFFVSVQEDKEQKNNLAILADGLKKISVQLKNESPSSEGVREVLKFIEQMATPYEHGHLLSYRRARDMFESIWEQNHEILNTIAESEAIDDLETSSQWVRAATGHLGIRGFSDGEGLVTYKATTPEDIQEKTADLLFKTIPRLPPPVLEKFLAETNYDENTFEMLYASPKLKEKLRLATALAKTESLQGTSVPDARDENTKLKEKILNLENRLKALEGKNCKKDIIAY